MSFKESLQRLSKCLGQGLEVAPEVAPIDSDWSKDCPPKDQARPGGYGPGRFGPGRWDPCYSSVSDPGCRGVWPGLFDLCPCDRTLGIVEYFACCRNTQPPLDPPMGYGPPWDGDCNNPPRMDITCYRDTTNDPPESHGWHCCKDDKQVWPGNPDYEYTSIFVVGGNTVAQVPDPPKPPGFKPGRRPSFRPGFGRPGVINPNPPQPPGPDVYVNPCQGKDTGGKVCCHRIPGHRQTRWRGYTRKKCLNPEYARYISECQGGGEGGGGSSG